MFSSSEPLVFSGSAIKEPEFREFRFDVQKVNDDVELVSLLGQVMECYPEADRIAAATWLAKLAGLKVV